MLCLYSNEGNEITDIKIWTNMVILKAKQFINTTKIKNMKGKSTLHYDELYDKPISMKHLHSVILYCDFSILSTSFTKTFREIDERESLTEIKQRNKAYYHLSKWLFQTIHGYGYKLYDWETKQHKHEVLYSGMSVILNMKNTDLYLRGPTSASRELIIAQNFSKGNGVILELSGGSFEPRFDASWISRYPEEAERVFMFGYRSLKLVSIRIQINLKWQNYEAYYEVLYCIELVTKGHGISKDDKISSKQHVLILEGLLSFNLSIPEYVRNCWLLFINNTKALDINYHWLGTHPKYIVSSVLFGDYKKEEHGLSDDIDLHLDMNQNMINTKFIKIFNNLETICINCGNYEY